MNATAPTSRLIRAALLLMGLSLPTGHAAAAPDAAPLDKLQIILDRAPFGPPPAPVPVPADTQTDAARIPEDETRPRLSDGVRLSAMTRFNGVPAAGLVDLETGRSFFLLEGQTLGGFRLEEVSFETSSVILTQADQTDIVYLTYAQGQATNLVLNADDRFLSVINRNSETPTAAGADPATPPPDSTAPRDDPVETDDGDSDYPPELIAAATIVEPDGSTRISFRELHRLRVQASREQAERERREREERARREREQAEAHAKAEAEVAAITAQAEAAAEQLRRKQILNAIKEGYDVEIDFELTPAEARELAEAGFDIAVEDIPPTDEEEPAHEE